MPKIVDVESTKQKILSRCFQLFARKGLSNVGMRQISEQLKISTGKLYHYFPSKENLFISLTQWLAKENILLAHTFIHEGMSTTERLSALMVFVQEKEEHLQNFFFILSDYYRFHESSTQDEGDILKKIAQGLSDSIAQLLNIEDKAMAGFLFTYINGFIFRNIVDPQWPLFKEELALLGDLFKQKEKSL